MKIGIDSEDMPSHVLPGQWEHEQNIPCKTIFSSRNEYLTEVLWTILDTVRMGILSGINPQSLGSHLKLRFHQTSKSRRF